VTDESGAPFGTNPARSALRKLKIWIPGAVDTVKTVVVRYRVLNGLKFFEEHDELYWNVTGDEWEVPIERARAVVRLPAGVAGIRSYAFTGGYGSQESAGAHYDGRNDADHRDDEGAELPRGRHRGDRVEPGSASRAPDPADKTRDFVLANAVLLIRSSCSV